MPIVMFTISVKFIFSAVSIIFPEKSWAPCFVPDTTSVRMSDMTWQADATFRRFDYKATFLGNDSWIKSSKVDLEMDGKICQNDPSGTSSWYSKCPMSSHIGTKFSPSHSILKLDSILPQYSFHGCSYFKFKQCYEVISDTAQSPRDEF